MEDPYLRFAFALDGLIRSRVTGDGGEEFARKNIRLIAEALREIRESTELLEKLNEVIEASSIAETNRLKAEKKLIKLIKENIKLRKKIVQYNEEN